MATPGLIDRAGRFKGSDFIQYYVMGSLLLEGRADVLYDADAHLSEGRRRIHPELSLFAGHANYPPLIAALFAPLARLPFGLALGIFLGLSAAVYALSVWLVWRECPALREDRWLVALVAAASPLFMTVLRYGQLSAFTLCLFALALVAFGRGRPFAAGLAIGSLAYKPQLGLVAGVVLLACREWRAVCGAVTAAAGQLAAGGAVAGTAVMREYVGVLWTLALNPGLVQLYPSEVHSLRGFFRLLLPFPSVVTVCFLIAVLAVLVVGVRSWRAPAPAAFKWGHIVLLTVLASPHLLAYDLILLTVPLLVLADWCVRRWPERASATIPLLLVPLYFAPFSGNLARVIQVQVSVVVMCALAVVVYRELEMWKMAGVRARPEGRTAG
jgi:alpha-1,2-mannosyltransferase